MYGDIMRSYSSVAIGPMPGSLGKYNSHWSKKTTNREPLKLKLSILSDMHPATRSILNGTPSSYPSVWNAENHNDRTGGPDKAIYGNDNGVTLAVVGIKRTASNWLAAGHQEGHFQHDPLTNIGSTTAGYRGRVKSEPAHVASTSSPPLYSKQGNISMDNSATFSPFTGSFYRIENGAMYEGDPSTTSERIPADRQNRRGYGIDTDDKLDEVFASIVRRELTDDALLPTQTQTRTATEADSEHLSIPLRTSYKSTSEIAGTSNDHFHSRRQDDLIGRPFLPKLEYSSSERIASPTVYQSYEKHQPSKYGRSEQSAIDQEKPLSRLLEKVTRDCTTKNFATAAQLDDVWLHRPTYYSSAVCTPRATGCSREIEKRAGSPDSAEIAVERGGLWRENKRISTDSNLYLRKSDPFLNRKRESLQKVESFFGRENRHLDDSPLLDKKQISASFIDGKTFASSGTSYYGEDITSSNRHNRGQLFDDPAGKLRTAKSESSLRMAKPKLLLSDKEIYQIKIMNTGRSVCRFYVCQCLANLYFDDTATSNNEPGAATWANSGWRHVATGVPVLILESDNPTGRANATPRRLLIRLTELGNGFKLWEDAIDAFSGYTVDRTFHTLVMSMDKGRAGLSFDSNSAALEFHQHVREFSEELDYFALNNGERRKRRNNKGIWSAFRRLNVGDGTGPSNDGGHSRQQEFGVPAYRRNPDWPTFVAQQPPGPLKKADISSPCWFEHVTSLKPGDQLPSAMLVNSDCSSAGCSSTGTLTRVNRAATIKSANSKLHQTAAPEENAGIISLPKRAQSCTQIVLGHSQKWDANEGSSNYHTMNTLTGTNGSHFANDHRNYGTLSRRYDHSTSVEPMH